MEKLFDNLYSRFFLRDFLGYILSGSILEYYCIQAYCQTENIIPIELFDYTLTMILVFIFLGYLFGICISAICNVFENLLKKPHKKINLFDVKFDSKTDNRLLTILLQKDEWIAQRDRFVSLKEITSKNCISLFISLLTCIKWELNLPRWSLIIPIIILLYEWYYFTARQEQFERAIKIKSKKLGILQKQYNRLKKD